MLSSDLAELCFNNPARMKRWEMCVRCSVLPRWDDGQGVILETILNCLDSDRCLVCTRRDRGCHRWALFSSSSRTPIGAVGPRLFDNESSCHHPGNRTRRCSTLGMPAGEGCRFTVAHGSSRFGLGLGSGPRWTLYAVYWVEVFVAGSHQCG